MSWGRYILDIDYVDWKYLNETMSRKASVAPEPGTKATSVWFSKDAGFNEDGTAEDVGFVKDKKNDKKKDASGKEKTEEEKIRDHFQEECDREPVKYCAWIAKHPKTAFYTMLSLQFLPVMLTAVLMVFGFQLFPIEFNSLPLYLNDVTRARGNAWRYRNTYDNRLTISADTGLPTWLLGYTVDGLELIYTQPNVDIYTKEKFTAIQQIEDELYNVPGYQTYFCQKEATGTCKKPVSILRFFDGTYSSINSTFNDPNYDNIAQVIALANDLTDTKSKLQFHLGADAYISIGSLTAYSSITRTLIPLGWPLAHVTGTTDEKQKKVTEFVVNNFLPIVEKYQKSTVSGMDLIYYSRLLFIDEIQSQAIKDMLLAIGSMFFIFVAIYIQTGSLWITGFSILSIITAFMTTNFIYSVVIGYNYFGFFHVLSIFIILGIGADDIFVYTDTWKHTKTMKFKSLAHRISYAYRRSAITMLATSLTTMLAFVASAISPLLAVQSFGVFSAILILVNYLGVILFLPTVVTFHELYFDKYDCLCCKCACCNKNKVETSPPPSRQAIVVRELSAGQRAAVEMFVGRKVYKNHDLNVSGEKEENGKADSSKTNKDNDEMWVSSGRRVVRCFGDGYFRFINHPATKWTMVALFTSMMIVAAIFAAKLRPDERLMRFYVESHNFGKAEYHRLYSFMPTDDNPYTLSVYLLWGSKPNDLSSCHFSAPSCPGTSVADSTFSMNTEAAQTSFLNLCNSLKSMSSQQALDLMIGRDLTTNQLKISCFMPALETYMASENVTLPLNSTKMTSFMNGYPAIYGNASLLSSSFNNYFEVGVENWLSNGYSFNYTDDYGAYNNLIGLMNDTYTTTVGPLNYSTTTGFYGSKIRYMAIQINTTIDRRSLAFTSGIPLMNKYETFMQTQLASMPAELANGFQCTRSTWHWLHVQENLFNNALIGLGIGLGCAVPVILFSTQNFLLTVISLICLMGITLCVCAMIPLLGWKLGVLESLNMCLVVGLSIDYCVHLAEGYYHSLYRKRADRLRDTLERVGVSILSGAATTLGASFFLLFAKIQFFVQFGIFMFCTIGFSLIFSLFFFTSLLGLFGPENDACSFAPCCERNCSCKEEREEEIVEEPLDILDVTDAGVHPNF